MKKLTKEQLKDTLKVAQDLEMAHQDLDAAISKYNEAMAPLWQAVEDSVTHYNECLAEARVVQESVISDIQEYIDGKSDKWRDSEKGSAYESWKSSWEDIDMEDIFIGEPDPLEAEIEEHHTLINEAQTELMD